MAKITCKLVIVVLTFAQPLLANTESKYLFLINKFESKPSEIGYKLSDSIQLRVRRRIKEENCPGYVYSWIEIENIPFDEIINSLKQNQTLFVVSGKLDKTNGYLLAQVKIKKYPGGSSLSKKEFKNQANELWKRKLSSRISKYILSVTVGLKDLKPPPARYEFGENILKNGNFQKGKGFEPANWDMVDNLVSFWEVDREGNRYIKFDTRVLQDQVYDWYERLKSGANPKDAPKPIFAPPPCFQAVGGIEGVKLYSNFIPIEPGKTYLLKAKIKGPPKGQAKVFVKCYALLPKASLTDTKLYKREVWRMYMHCNTINKWKEYSQIFTIPAKLKPVRAKKKNADGKIEVKVYNPKIQWARVMLYAYWRVGIYYFDDVQLCPASKIDDTTGKK